MLSRRQMIALSATALAATAADAEPPLRLTQRGDRLLLSSALSGGRAELLATAPIFDFGAFQLGGPAAGSATWRHTPREGWQASWQVVAPRAGTIRARLWTDQATGVLRKVAQIQLHGGEPALLRRVVVDVLTAPGQRFEHREDIQSHPVLGRSLFAGIEFPMADVRAHGDTVELAHVPGCWVQPGVVYRSRAAVYGAAPAGAARAAFERYISSLRPRPHGVHFNYNSWWTSPVPYTEADIRRLIAEFDSHLFGPYGVSPDTFCIDMGWAKNTTLWGVDPALFPHGFGRLHQACAAIRSHLGLWISPSGVYAQALDLAWAARAGYEADSKACLAGPRYRGGITQALTSMARRDGLGHVKLDGYVPTCDAVAHGHEPGRLSAEAIADGMIAVMEAVRSVAPDVWLEPTCFGPDSSPWWLAHANSVTGAFGDDAPHGRVPCPAYRQSYTTGRDYYNLKGARDIGFPIAAQEVLGIIHQTPEPLQDDAVTTVLRGNQFVSLYVNPAHMTPRRWEFLAALMKWARANQDVLGETRPILPASWRRTGGGPGLLQESPMPREPYGYGHWRGRRGLICLRNPWIEPAVVTIDPARDAGAPAQEKLHASVIYPMRYRLTARTPQQATYQVELAPYETCVVELTATAPSASLPARPSAPRPAAHIRSRASRIEVTGDGPAYGADYTRLLPPGHGYLRVRLEGEVNPTGAGRPQLLLLLEDQQPVEEPIATLSVDGEPTPIAIISSEGGWRATGRPVPEHWLWAVAHLPQAACRLAAEVMAGGKAPTVAAWVVERQTVPWRRLARVDGRRVPPPEERFISSVRVLAPVSLSPDLPYERIDPPVVRIQGIYLDALEPASVEQGWGTLQRNRSVWEKPITVGGRRFARGLGTHAPSRIVYDLGGRYARFRAWAGADQATGPTITMEVRVDGHSVWKSGLLTRESPAQRVDVSVAGASELELLAGDGGNGLSGDHADWADAMLLTGGAGR